MGPFQAIGKLAQETACGYRTAVSSTDIRKIGEIALELLGVFVSEWQWPAAILGRDAGGYDFVGQCIVGTHNGCSMVAECDDAGAGQGCDVDDGVWLETPRVRQCIAKDKPPLGVGIEYLDSLSRHAPDDVAGLGGDATWQILNGRHNDVNVDRQLEFYDGGHRADHAGSTTHIEFHFVHTRAGFQRDTARIECDALTDEHDRLLSGLAFVLHDDQAGRLLGPGRHREE